MRKKFFSIIIFAVIICSLTSCFPENKYDGPAIWDPNFGKRGGISKTEVYQEYEILSLGENTSQEIESLMYESDYSAFSLTNLKSYADGEDLYCEAEIDGGKIIYRYVRGVLYYSHSLGELNIKKKCEAEFSEAKLLISSFVDTNLGPTPESFLDTDEGQTADGERIITYTGLANTDEYDTLATTMGIQLGAEGGVASGFKLENRMIDGDLSCSEFSWELTAETAKGQVKLLCLSGVRYSEEEFSIAPPTDSSAYERVSSIDMLLFD